MQFSQFIKENREAILEEWETFARSLPPGKGMDVAQLRDHAQEILETIAEDMASAQSGAEQEDKSKGEGRLRSCRWNSRQSTPALAMKKASISIRLSRSTEP